MRELFYSAVENAGLRKPSVRQQQQQPLPAAGSNYKARDAPTAGTPVKVMGEIFYLSVYERFMRLRHALLLDSNNGITMS